MPDYIHLELAVIGGIGLQKCKIMRPLFLAFIVLACSATKGIGSDFQDTSSKKELGFRFLHRQTQDGFIEFDFQPDGTLYVYLFSEADSSSGSEVEQGHYEPVFSVEKQYWGVEGNELTIYRGAERTRFPFKVLEKEVSWGEFSASKVDKLRFLEAVSEYTALKNRQK